MKELTLGIKFTHDSTVALFEGNNLLFSVESEKLNNGDRYKKAETKGFVQEILDIYGYKLEDIDNVIVDGWWGNGKLRRLDIETDRYYDFDSDLTASTTHINNKFPVKYDTYKHILGHILGTYACSKFSKNKEKVYSLVFDGGQPPRIDLVNPDSRTPVKFIDHCHVFTGSIYGVMGLYYGPYKDEKVISGEVKNVEGVVLVNSFGAPGKIMSYIALGVIDKEVLYALYRIYDFLEDGVLKEGLMKLTHGNSCEIEHLFMRSVFDRFPDKNEANMLLTLHTFLEELLVERVLKIVPENNKLIYSGGSALNIKWNSALVETGYFDDIFIAPFANDTGSAIGMACSHLALEHDIWSVNWSVYSGTELINTTPSDKWSYIEMSPEELGKLLYDCNECIVVLNGKAEIGPRSLGHRSLMMSTVVKGNKEILNKIKRRESFRPVAPISLPEDAYNHFYICKDDKYMLYDHLIKDESREIIPAIIHLDSTARVQIIREYDSNFVFRVLESYKNYSGVGILCNTSANHNGKGFFPDTKSATDWAENNGVNYVFSNGILYSR